MKPSKSIRRYLELAKRQALQSPFRRQQHGCIIVKGGRIINSAHNNVCYSRFANRFRDPNIGGHASRHAEIRAVLGIDVSQTRGATAVVVRINGDGEFCLSRPCEMCISVLEFVGIKKIVYTKDNNKIGIERL